MAIAKTKAPPEIITIGKRQMISTGQFNIARVADKVIEEAVNDWLPVSSIAKFVYGRAFKKNNDLVRRRIWSLRKELVRRGFLLIYEGRPIEYVKIYVPESEVERQLAETLVEKMRTKSDISAAEYEKALGLLNLKLERTA